jgi:membrane protein
MIAAMKFDAWLLTLKATLRTFPWRETARTLAQRFREDRLGNTASSLTFTTLISLVPLFTVVLAVFTVFPMFGKLQLALQQWLADSLIPEPIAKQVMGYLTQFAAKSSRLGLAGIVVLLVTAISLILTIDRTLNAIWRVRRARPLAQRVLVYWGVLTLGPLLLAGSLAMTSFIVSASTGWMGTYSGGFGLLLNIFQFTLIAGGVAALYRYVPNTEVKWNHALSGGVFVATGLELAKRLLAWYLANVPAYSTVYGAFASVPILLMWVYVLWLIVLLGAVIAAYLPSLLSGIARRADQPGWRFELALELLRQLQAQRAGRHLLELAQALRVDPLQLEEPLEVIEALGWTGCLQDGRYVLLVDPASTALSPLAERLLLVVNGNTRKAWDRSQFRATTLQDVI